MFERIQQWLDPVPEPVLGLLVLGIAAAFVWATLVDWRKERSIQQPAGRHADAEPQEHEAPSCHDHDPVRATKGGTRHGH